MTIYLDYNATTPMDSEVVQEIIDGCTHYWKNPSSSYASSVKSALAKAREAISGLIGADDSSESITFTSGGTESNHMALHSAIGSFRSSTRKGGIPHVVTTNIEHPAIELPLRKWEKEKAIEVTFVPVKRGRVEVEDVKEAIRSNTCLVTIMMANNETGIIQPIEEIGEMISELNENRRQRILFHTDAAQTVGKIPVDVRKLKVDYLSLAGHKFYGPRIGALYHRPTTAPIFPIFSGGGQEFSRRPGTENLPMILGLAKAGNRTLEGDHHSEKIRELRDSFQGQLKERLGGDVSVNFDDLEILPNTSSVSFNGLESHELLKRLIDRKVEASTSAACHSSNSYSSVLINSGLSPEEAKGTIRFSFGKFTTKQEIRDAVDIICQEVQALRKNN